MWNKVKCGTPCQGYYRGGCFICVQNKTQHNPVLEEKPSEGI